MADGSLFPILVLSFIGGILLGDRGPAHGLWLYCCAMALGLWLLLRAKGKGLLGARLLALLFFLALGAWNSQRMGGGASRAGHLVLTGDAEWVDLEGILIEAPELRHDGTRLLLEVQAVFHGPERRKATAKVLLTVGKGGERFRYGDRLRLKSKLHPPVPRLNPGQRDWARQLYLRGVTLQGFLTDADHVLVLGRACGHWARQRVEDLRWELTRTIGSEFPGPAREVLLALVVGQGKALAPQMREAFAALGLSHLLAISGLHFGLVALFVYGVARKLLVRFQGLILRFPLEKMAWMVTVPVLMAYGGVAGMSPSVQRALIMALALAAALLLDRVRRLYHSLALAALIILVINPASLFELSFQLSFLAVLGILYGVPRAMSLLPEPGPLVRVAKPGALCLWLRRALLAALTTGAASLATMPLSVVHFHLVPLLGVPANLVGVPLIGWVILPLALVGSFLYWIWAPAGSGLLWVAAWMIDWVVQILAWAASWGRGLYLPTPKPWEVGIFYGICIGVFQLRKAAWARWATAGLLLALALLWAGEWALKALDRRLGIHFIAVGNGASVLMEAPGGRTLLLDGGGSREARPDVGALQVAPVLWEKRKMGLDRVLLTHPHPDHWKGLLFILRAFRVREGVWDNGDRPHGGSYSEFLNAVTAAGWEPKALCEGTTWSIGDARFQVLHPPCSGRPIRGPSLAAGANNRSLVLRISMGEVSFLLPADIEAEQERRLVQRGGLGSTVLLAPHHGSRTSNTEPFLKAVGPRFAVFSSKAGPGGLAHAEVRERYRGLGIETFHTGEDGMVSFITDGRVLWVESYLSGRRHRIMVSNPSAWIPPASASITNLDPSPLRD